MQRVRSALALIWLKRVTGPHLLFFFLLLNGLLTRPRDQRLLWLIFTLLL